MSTPTPTTSGAGQPSGVKICIHCKQDCAGKPRLKDASGAYACKACAEAFAAKQAGGGAGAGGRAKAAPSAPASTGSGFDDAPLSFDAPTEQPAFALPKCPGCSLPFTPGTQICMNCGYNIAKGRASKTRVSKQLVTAGEVTSMLTTANPLMWAIGGCAGGAIGAAIWITIVVATDREIGWVAWGVGALAGLGVGLVARSRAGMFSGVMAVIIAIAALGIAKYGVVSIVVDRAVATEIKEIEGLVLTDEIATSMVADELCAAEESRGVKLAWPQGSSADDATTKEEYPPGIWDKAAAQWKAATEPWREEFKTAQIAKMKADMNAGLSEFKSEVFKQTFSPFDLLWAALAIASAFKLGAGFSSDD